MSIWMVYQWRRSGGPAVTAVNLTPCRLAADRTSSPQGAESGPRDVVPEGRAFGDDPIECWQTLALDPCRQGRFPCGLDRDEIRSPQVRSPAL
jgi:hypothetical protein